MRWILCGKNTAAVECLEILHEHGDEVWVLPIASDSAEDGWQLSLKKRAQEFGDRIDQPANINAADCVARLAEYGADGLISVQYDQILRQPLFDSIGCPCLNLHFALLPRHRGVAPIAWALVAGDAEIGATLHHMTVDIDAGDIVARRSLPIEPQDTARQLYDKVSDASVALFREQYPFRAGVQRRAQDAGEALYHRNGDFDFSVKTIDWSRPAQELHRWIRAMTFPPMQYPLTHFRGQRLAVKRVGGTIGDADGAAPGTVVRRAGDEFEVAAGAGGSIVVHELVADDPQAADLDQLHAGGRLE